jgi:tetratricopeptide (TPR) repeat protein
LFQEAEAYSREANDPFTQMRVANCLGWVYHELHDLDRALQRNQESAAMAQVFPWPEPLANALVNLAFDHLQRGELAQCQARLQAAQDLLEKDEWMRWRWHTRLLLASGALSLRRADLDDAREAFLQAQSLAAKTGARKNMARACLWLGRLALATGEAEDAQRTLARAAELAAAVHNPRLGWLSLEALGDAQQRMDDPEGARRAWKAAAELLMHTAAELPDHPLRRSFLASPRAAAILAKAQNPS